MKTDNTWLTDIRVQARHLKKGDLDPKDLEKLLKDLPDGDGKYESVSIPQPALADDLDDEDDADDEDDGE